MRPIPEIFFSYAWGDEYEPGESRESIVDDLYQFLLSAGFKVIRDKYDIEYHEYISEFMARIGKGKCIIVAISRKYLKSPYCMFELYEIARNSNFDKHLFAQRVLPIIVEYVDFTDAVVIDEHIAFWENEYNDWDSLLKRRGGQISVEQMQRFDKIRMINQNFGRLSEWIIDIRSLNPGLLSSGKFQEIKKALLVKAGYHHLDEPNFWERLIRAPTFWIFIFFLFASVVWYALSGSNNSKLSNEQMNTMDTLNFGSSTGSVAVASPEKKEIVVDPPPDDGKKAEIKHSVNPPPVIKLPADTIFRTPELMCTIKCITNGFVGVEVSFSDPESGVTYTDTSSSTGVLEFLVPCRLKNEPITVYFTKGNLSDPRPFRLKDLEIPPSLFKPQ